MTTKSLNKQQKLIELRANGHFLQSIANELSISKQTVVNWVKELEVEINNSKTLALDALYEQHLMTKQTRIELLSEQLTKVKTELSKRTLEDISTEKLFDMQLKLLIAMKQEKEKLSLIEESTTPNFRSIVASKEYYSIDN